MKTERRSIAPFFLIAGLLLSQPVSADYGDYSDEHSYRDHCLGIFINVVEQKYYTGQGKCVYGKYGDKQADVVAKENCEQSADRAEDCIPAEMSGGGRLGYQALSRCEKDFMGLACITKKNRPHCSVSCEWGTINAAKEDALSNCSATHAYQGCDFIEVFSVRTGRALLNQ